jgi:hypothetical protein
MRARFYAGLGLVQLLYVIVGILYISDPNLHPQLDQPKGVVVLITRIIFFSTTIILAGVAIYTDRLRDELTHTIQVVEVQEPDRGI